MLRIFHRFARLVRHRWAEMHLNKILKPETLKELESLIAHSELSHTGQVRICVEAGLPWSYIWRDATPRQRAISMFSKLRIWDTEHNNGVLIYMLLADHAIEIVADRALDRTMTPNEWKTVLSDMSSAFQGGHYTVGLTAALERVSNQLQTHFPRPNQSGESTEAVDNSLPDAPVIQRHFPGRSS